MSTYQLPDLRYDPGALEPHLSGRIVDLHHGAHHRAYVDGANKTLERLAEARAADDFASLVGLQKTLAFNVSGHVLHSIYWDVLGPDAQERPTGDLAAAIDESFGSFDRMAAHLTQATVGVQGSGWGLLSWDPTGQTLVVEQIEDHHHNTVIDARVLVAIDAWEHAYYLQYENRRAAYAEVIWNVLDWRRIETRFQLARRAVGASSQRAA